MWTPRRACLKAVKLEFRENFSRLKKSFFFNCCKLQIINGSCRTHHRRRQAGWVLPRRVVARQKILTGFLPRRSVANSRYVSRRRPPPRPPPRPPAPPVRAASRCAACAPTTPTSKSPPRGPMDAQEKAVACDSRTSVASPACARQSSATASSSDAHSFRNRRLGRRAPTYSAAVSARGGLMTAGTSKKRRSTICVEQSGGWSFKCAVHARGCRPPYFFLYSPLYAQGSAFSTVCRSPS